MKTRLPDTSLESQDNRVYLEALSQLDAIGLAVLRYASEEHYPLLEKIDIGGQGAVPPEKQTKKGFSGAQGTVFVSHHENTEGSLYCDFEGKRLRLRYPWVYVTDVTTGRELVFLWHERDGFQLRRTKDFTSVSDQSPDGIMGSTYEDYDAFDEQRNIYQKSLQTLHEERSGVMGRIRQLLLWVRGKTDETEQAQESSMPQMPEVKQRPISYAEAIGLVQTATNGLQRMFALLQECARENGRTVGDEKRNDIQA